MFVVRMAWREMRWAWRRLLFFFLCLSIGVASIVTLRSVVQGVRAALLSEARTRLGGDLALSTSGVWDDAARGVIGGLVAPYRAAAASQQVETLTMVRPADPAKAASRLVELLGVDPAYPLYGTVELDGGGRYTHRLLERRGLLVRPELLAQLDVAVGDDVIIGDARFTIRGVVLAEPGRRAGAFSFGTRVFVDLEDLKTSGLLGFGSRATHRMLVKMPGRDTERLARDLRQAFRGRFVSVRTSRSAEDEAGPRTRAGRELPQPGRPHHRAARRGRGLERDSRLRPAEAPQRGGSEVRRRQYQAGSGGLRRAGRLDGPDGQRHRRDPGGRRGGVAAARRCRRHWRRGGRRADRQRRRAGRGHRAAGRAAVRPGAAARRAARATVDPAAGLGAPAAPARRRVVRHDVRHRGPAGGDGRVAGRVVACGPDSGHRVCGRVGGAGGRGHPARAGDAAPAAEPSPRHPLRVAPGRTAREPGSAGAAGRGTWNLPRGRRARAPGGLAAGDGGQHAAGLAGHVPHRCPAGPGRRRARVSPRARRAGRGDADPGAARADHGDPREGDRARQLRGRPQPGTRAWPGVRGHIPRGPGGQ